MEILEIQLIENLHRENLNPVEEALGYLSLYRMKMGDESITAKDMVSDLMLFERDPERLKGGVVGNLPTILNVSGKSTTYVRRLECILTLPERALEAVKKGVLNKSQAQVFVENIDHESFDKVLDETLSKEMTADMIREAFGGKKSKKTEEKKERKRGGNIAFFGKRISLVKKDAEKFKEQLSLEHIEELITELEDFVLQLGEYMKEKKRGGQ